MLSCGLRRRVLFPLPYSWPLIILMFFFFQKEAIYSISLDMNWTWRVKEADCLESILLILKQHQNDKLVPHFQALSSQAHKLEL